MIQRVAMKAVIVNDKGQVLILREAATYGEGTQRGRYQFPGGRIETGEHPEAALMREVKEESGLKVKPQRPLHFGEWRPVIGDTPYQIIGIFVICKPLTSTVTLSSEHDEYKWIDPADWVLYDIMPPEDKAIEIFCGQQNK